jgi:hypothetical protein
MRLLDLFSGIGGFSLGLERAGFETVAFCEVSAPCRHLLNHHWPKVPCYDDIRTLTTERLAAMELPSMPSAGDSPVRTLVKPAGARASTGLGQVFGGNTPGSLASYDPASSSWKTSQLSLVAGLDGFSETWPRSGMMLGGIAYQLSPLAPLTRGIASGLLPTLVASNTKAVALRSGGRPPRNWLKPLPTMVARDCRSIKGAARAPNAQGGEPLSVQVAQALGVTSGALNPTWCEWFMGYPAEWTACMALAMPSSRKSRKS